MQFHSSIYKNTNIQGLVYLPPDKVKPGFQVFIRYLDKHHKVRNGNIAFSFLPSLENRSASYIEMIIYSWLGDLHQARVCGQDQCPHPLPHKVSIFSCDLNSCPRFFFPKQMQTEQLRICLARYESGSMTPIKQYRSICLWVLFVSYRTFLL